MDGLRRNVGKLFAPDGKLFLAAFDHPQVYGALQGLERPQEAIGLTSAPGLDGYIINPGLANILDEKTLYGKKLVLRASIGGTAMGGSFPDWHKLVCSPTQALRWGADAVLVMLVLGGSHDQESMEQVAKTARIFHRFSIPVIAEVLAADFGRNNDTELVRNGARIGAELGADIIKAFYCEDFHSVVANCPVPVLLAGGPKEAGIEDIARSALDAGAAGFAFGRNIFQAEDPAMAVRLVCRILGRLHV